MEELIHIKKTNNGYLLKSNYHTVKTRLEVNEIVRDIASKAEGRPDTPILLHNTRIDKASMDLIKSKLPKVSFIKQVVHDKFGAAVWETIETSSAVPVAKKYGISKQRLEQMCKQTALGWSIAGIKARDARQHAQLLFEEHVEGKPYIEDKDGWIIKVIKHYSSTRVLNGKPTLHEYDREGVKKINKVTGPGRFNKKSVVFQGKRTPLKELEW